MSDNTTPPQLLVRYDWLHGKPNGTLFVHPAGAHYIVVSKLGNQLLLSIVDRQDPRSNFVQTALDITQPLALQFDYMQAMLLSLLWVPQPERIGMLGLGGGALPLVLHHFLPQATIDCIEISPTVVDVARRFFGFQPDERLQLCLSDGRDFLATQTTRYDILLMDIFLDKGQTPSHLLTIEFQQLCRQRLNDNGVLVVNIAQDGPLGAERLHTLRQVFPYVTICPVSDVTWVCFAATRPPRPGHERLTLAQSLATQHAFPFPLHHWATKLVDSRTLPAGTNPSPPTLTDATPSGTA